MKHALTMMAVALAVSSVASAQNASQGSTHLQQLQLPPEVLAQLRARRGPEQRPLELVQTFLLNQFGQLGFTELGEMRKVGESYVASVRAGDGQWTRVVIDPAAGTLSTRPAAGFAPAPNTGAAASPAAPTNAATMPVEAERATAGSPEAARRAGTRDRAAASSIESFMNRYECTEASLAELADEIGDPAGTPAAPVRPLVRAAQEASEDGNYALCQLRLRQIGQLLAGPGDPDGPSRP